MKREMISKFVIPFLIATIIAAYGEKSTMDKLRDAGQKAAENAKDMYERATARTRTDKTMADKVKEAGEFVSDSAKDLYNSALNKENQADRAKDSSSWTYYQKDKDARQRANRYNRLNKGSVADKAKDAANTAYEKAKDAGQRVVDSAKNTFEQAAERIKTDAGQYVTDSPNNAFTNNLYPGRRSLNEKSRDEMNSAFQNIKDTKDLYSRASNQKSANAGQTHRIDPGDGVYPAYQSVEDAGLKISDKSKDLWERTTTDKSKTVKDSLEKDHWNNRIRRNL